LDIPNTGFDFLDIAPVLAVASMLGILAIVIFSKKENA